MAGKVCTFIRTSGTTAYSRSAAGSDSSIGRALFMRVYRSTLRANLVACSRCRCADALLQDGPCGLAASTAARADLLLQRPLRRRTGSARSAERQLDAES